MARPPRSALPLFGSPLTPTERQLLAAIADGLTLQASAAQAGLAVWAAKDTLQRAGSRLGQRTQAGMVGAALRSGELRLRPLAIPEPVLCQCTRCREDADAGRGLPARLAADCERRVREAAA